jgi:hypothetical protein
VYRGAPNWETWAVYAWIQNVEHLYWDFRERAEEISEENDDDRIAEEVLATELRLIFNDPESIVAGRSAIAQDVTDAELETVDWNHVANNLLSEVRETGSKPAK